MTALAVGGGSSVNSVDRVDPVVEAVVAWGRGQCNFSPDRVVAINLKDHNGNVTDRWRINAWERIKGGFCDRNRIRQSWYVSVDAGGIDIVISDLTRHRVLR